MEPIQLALSNTSYMEALKAQLMNDGGWDVACVSVPSPDFSGVMVVDCSVLEQLSLPISNPERAVLICKKDPRCMARAWQAGIVSVVFEDDPLCTAMLAIMSASLRVCKKGGTCAVGNPPPASSFAGSHVGERSSSSKGKNPQFDSGQGASS